MRKQKHELPPIIGGASLIMVFTVLCLTVFTLLTLGTVQADRRLSEISAQAVIDYYAADSQAEEIFAQLRSGQCPENVIVRGDCYSYSCSISETQTLWVELTCSDGIWTVLRWQSVATTK